MKARWEQRGSTYYLSNNDWEQTVRKTETGWEKSWRRTGDRGWELVAIYNNLKDALK